MRIRAVYWLVETAVLLGIWLLFVAQLQFHESIVGLGAAILATTAFEAVLGTEKTRFLPDLRWLARAKALPAEILRDCALLVRNLLSGRDGVFIREPFQAGGQDARSVACRTLETTYRTLPPNSLVIGIDRRRNEILLHVLEGKS